MEQNNNKNLETFDSSAQTAVFNPVSDEKSKSAPPVNKPVRDTYERKEDFEISEDEKSSDVNAILLGVVIVLVILFIAALIWGTFVLKEINKRETEKAEPLQAEELLEEEIVEEEAEETFEKEVHEEKEQKIKCTISFKTDSVEEEDLGYTIRAIFKDGKGKYYTERLTVDNETQIKEDTDYLSYKSFINNVIKTLGSREVEFNAVVDKDSNHIDSIFYKSEILEPEEEGIVLEEETLPQEEKTEEAVSENVIE